MNRWNDKEKTIYTIYSLVPEGFCGPLFTENISKDRHYVSLWNHEELAPVALNGKTYLPVTVRTFDKAWLGTRLEGNIDCIAKFPNYLNIKFAGDSLFIDANHGTKILLWAGIPSY